MPAGSAGCWTCRVRHKKCDLSTPSCIECSDRHVQCHGYGSRPKWMDGGLEERRERSRIKAAVRKNFRRVKKEQAEARHNSRRESQDVSITRADVEVYPVLTTTRPVQSALGGKPQANSEENQMVPPHATAYGNQSLTDPGWNVQETHLLMHYFDQVFPWQFPYHHTRRSLGNRGWLLLLFIKKGPLCQATLSLSSLHQSALLGTEQELLQNQRVFDRHSGVLRDMCELMSERGDRLIQDHDQLAELLACSVMLMSFEVARGGERDWLLHLNAVTSLMSHLSPERIFSCGEHNQGTNDDNGSLRFIMVTGLWFDILSCISTDRLPQLPYQRWLSIPGLHMADLMGCENWVLAAIGDLAYLAKSQTQKLDKVESSAELRARGNEIARDLENGINRLDIAIRVSAKESHTDWVSQFFAIAALVLCHSIVSGPSLNSPAIQNTVGKALVMLRYKEKSISLTGSVWALCIVGCMVSPPDRPYFESLMVELVHASGGIGNMATVLKIMRKCWEMQQFDQADCRDAMSELEINALLV